MTVAAQRISSIWPAPSRGRLALLVAIVLGATLIAAAALKAHAMAGERPPSAFTIAQLAVEVVLGVCLIVGNRREPLRFVALATFGVFAAVALYKAVIGLPSCGCFGKLHIPPLYTATFDVLAV